MIDLFHRTASTAVVRTRGTNESDFWTGTSGDDVYYGLGGLDSISGNSGNDRLYGGSAKDIIDGNFGDDKLDGDAGDDFLIGNYGNDILTGGKGHDNFYVYTEDTITTHKDVITDFEASGKNRETVFFDGNAHYDFDNLADIRSHMKQEAGGVRFNFFDGNFVDFEHAHVADFSMDNFHF